MLLKCCNKYCVIDSLASTVKQWRMISKKFNFWCMKIHFVLVDFSWQFKSFSFCPFSHFFLKLNVLEADAYYGFISLTCSFVIVAGESNHRWPWDKEDFCRKDVCKTFSFYFIALIVIFKFHFSCYKFTSECCDEYIIKQNCALNCTTQVLDVLTVLRRVHSFRSWLMS